MQKLLFLELNEINFDVVSFYIKKGEKLDGFEQLFKKGILNTHSEQDYQNLEPWVQWVSVHTGKTFTEHNIFRLGDFVNSKDKQFFEKVENAGFSVGAVSPMNASNNLRNPAYFIPDPWTQTPSDNSFLSKRVTNAIIQSVNDNSESRITFKTIINLGIAFIFLVNPKSYLALIKYAIRAFSKPWRRALFLDMLLYEIHKSLFNRKKPNFSTLFLNAGAHIQHHYFFNSPYVKSPTLKNPSWYINKDEDPFFEMLKIYNSMLVELLNQSDTEIIIATGLSQKPFEKVKFYYRLKNHSLFLKKFGISFSKVVPRMTRDFLISFENSDEAKNAEQKLLKIIVDNKLNLFEEIDNRGKDIFVVMTYPFEIFEDTKVSLFDLEFNLHEFVTFVAIKNGEHQSKGFAYFSKGVSKFAPIQESHVSSLHNTVLKFFGI